MFVHKDGKKFSCDEFVKMVWEAAKHAYACEDLGPWDALSDTDKDALFNAQRDYQIGFNGWNFIPAAV